MLKIWVDASVLAKNRARGRNDPPIIVSDIAAGTRRMGHEVALGEGVRMVHDPGCGNSCGVVHLIVTEPARAEIIR